MHRTSWGSTGVHRGRWEDFFVDLQFNHLKLRCYVVVEHKGGKFRSEHLGQLGFYIAAVDRQVKTEQDNPTIGLLLCKSKNSVVAEYALNEKTHPIGIAGYKLVESLPEDLRTSLPRLNRLGVKWKALAALKRRIPCDFTSRIQ